MAAAAHAPMIPRPAQTITVIQGMTVQAALVAENDLSVLTSARGRLANDVEAKSSRQHRRRLPSNSSKVKRESPTRSPVDPDMGQQGQGGLREDPPIPFPTRQQHQRRQPQQQQQQQHVRFSPMVGELMGPPPPRSRQLPQLQPHSRLPHMPSAALDYPVLGPRDLHPSAPRQLLAPRSQPLISGSRIPRAPLELGSAAPPPQMVPLDAVVGVLRSCLGKRRKRRRDRDLPEEGDSGDEGMELVSILETHFRAQDGPLIDGGYYYGDSRGSELPQSFPPPSHIHPHPQRPRRHLPHSQIPRQPRYSQPAGWEEFPDSEQARMLAVPPRGRSLGMTSSGDPLERPLGPRGGDGERRLLSACPPRVQPAPDPRPVGVDRHSRQQQLSMGRLPIPHHHHHHHQLEVAPQQLKRRVKAPPAAGRPTRTQFDGAKGILATVVATYSDEEDEDEEEGHLKWPGSLISPHTGEGDTLKGAWRVWTYKKGKEGVLACTYRLSAFRFLTNFFSHTPTLHLYRCLCFAPT